MVMRAAVLLSLVTMNTLSTASGQMIAGHGTGTTLSVAPVDSNVRAGAVFKLTAKIAGDSSVVTRGQVKFCDADVSRCEGLAIVGIAQVDVQGSASITLTLGPGKHRVLALFCGTPHSDPPAKPSSSQVQTITVGGRAKSAGSAGLI